MPHEDDPAYQHHYRPHRQVIDLIVAMTGGTLTPREMEEWPVDTIYRTACNLIKREQAMLKFHAAVPRLF